MEIWSADRHFQELARQLLADESLVEPGVALYIDAPVEVLPKSGVRLESIARQGMPVPCT